VNILKRKSDHARKVTYLKMVDVKSTDLTLAEECFIKGTRVRPLNPKCSLKKDKDYFKVFQRT